MLSKQQLALRRTGVGASQVAALVGIDPWKTAYKVWKDIIYGGSNISSEAAQWGHAIEPTLRDWHSQSAMQKILVPDETYRHKIYTHMIATPDGIYEHGTGLVECKTVDKEKRQEWGQEGTSEVPEHYLLQVQQQMEVVRSDLGLDIQYTDFAVLFGGNSYATFRVQFDPEKGELLGKIIERFWARYVETRNPPPVKEKDPERSEYLVSLYTRDNGLLKKLEDSEVEQTIFRLRKLRRTKKKLEEQEILLENRIKEHIGEHSGLSTPVGEIRWKPVETKPFLTKDALFNLLKQKGVTAEELDACKEEPKPQRKFFFPRT